MSTFVMCMEKCWRPKYLAPMCEPTVCVSVYQKLITRLTQSMLLVNGARNRLTSDFPSLKHMYNGNDSDASVLNLKWTLLPAGTRVINAATQFAGYSARLTSAVMSVSE